jgi:hypothetical protein
LHLYESEDGEHLLRLQPAKEKRIFKDSKDKTVTEKAGPSYDVYVDSFFEEYLADEVLFLAPGDTPSDIGLDDASVKFITGKIPEELQAFGYKSATELASESYNGLVRDDGGEVWQISDINKDSARPHAKLTNVGENEVVKVPLVDAQEKKFAERYSPITDPKKAQEIVSTKSSDVNEEAPEKTEAQRQGDKEGKDNIEYREKQPDESLLGYVYDRVNDEQKKLLKQIEKELTDSEYEGVERLQEKLASSPAEVLRAISGLESGIAHKDEFPKYEIMQILGAIERINREAVSQEDVRNMVEADYDSEWDVWQRVKANHVYERQDGTLLVNLSGSRHGLWSKFENEQAYEAYKDPEKKAQPIGRKRGIGDMLEYLREDIETVKSELSTESTKETEDSSIKSGDTVVLTEGGKKHKVEAVGEVNEQTIILLEDGRPKRIDEITKLDVDTEAEPQTPGKKADKAESKTMNETSQNIEVLSHKEILDVIHGSESVQEAVRKILESDKVYWTDNQYAYQKKGGEWAIYNETAEEDINELSQAEMKQKMRDAVVELNESVRLKIDNFVDGVLGSVDKIITAIEDESTDESVQDEIEFKQEYQTLRNKIVSQNDLLSRQEIKRYRDRFVKLMHWYKHKRPELWHGSKADYRTDVREIVVEIDQILDNSQQ